MLIDIALLLGIVLTLLKGAELFLLPQQQMAITEFFEDLILWLDDVHIDDLPSRYREEKIQTLILIFSWFSFFVLLSFGYLYGLLKDFIFTGATNSDYQSLMGRYLTSIVLAFAIILIFWKWPIRNVLRWVLDAEETRRLRRRGWIAFIIYIPASFIIVIIMYIITDLINKSTNLKIDATYWGDVIAIGWFFVAVATKFSANTLADIIEGTRSTEVKLFLSFTKGIVWRVVSFQKGVVSALVVLATICLTVLKILQ